MKKALLLLILLLPAVGKAVFAQPSINGYAYFTYMPLEWSMVYDPDKIRTDEQKEDDLRAGFGGYWGTNTGRFQLFIQQYTHLMGYQGSLLFENGGFHIERANAWVRPFDWLKFEAGRFDNWTLGGKVSADNRFNLMVLRPELVSSGFPHEQAIMYKFTTDQYGAELTFNPIPDLSINVGLPSLGGFTGDPARGFVSGGKAKEVYSKVHVSAGYVRHGFGHFRAQYIGQPKYPLDNVLEQMSNERRNVFINYRNLSRFELAFAYMQVRDLLIDFGIKFAPFLKGDQDAFYNPGIMFGLGVYHILGNFSYKFLASGHFANYYTISDSNIEKGYRYSDNFNFHFIPEYRYWFGTFGLNLGVDILGQEKIRDTVLASTGRVNFGAGAWFRKPIIGNGDITVGLAYTYLGVTGDGERQPGSTSGFFRIPVTMAVIF